MKINLFHISDNRFINILISEKFILIYNKIIQNLFYLPDSKILLCQFVMFKCFGNPIDSVDQTNRSKTQININNSTTQYM